MGRLRRADFDFEALTTDQDRCSLFSVDFAYNYLPNAPKFLSPQPIVFENPYRKAVEEGLASNSRDTHPNSIPLAPFLARLPWNSGLDSLRQNKYCESILRSTAEILHLFAEDESLNLTQNANGKAVASFAQKELATPWDDRYIRFTAYVVPDADEARAALLAQLILFISVFDDTWEETSGEPLKRFQDDFVMLLQRDVEPALSDTPLQKRISEIRQSVLSADMEMGNGGIETINALVEFVRHPPPHQEFRSLREYLDYRYKDIAMLYVYATVKFSICSDVKLESPKLSQYLHLVSDHVSLVNDMASYDKEYANWKHGKAKDLINVVDVVQNLLSLPSSDDAKAMSYAMQLSTEQAILEELEKMKLANELTLEEWRFVEAALTMAAGNIFAPIVLPRYGGEAARIFA